jgi:hypothetical protein
MRKYIPDLPMVVEAENAFIGLVGAAPRAPQCYKELGGACASLARAREEGADDKELRALGRNRFRAVEAVREYGRCGDRLLDSAFGRMESAAEAAGAAKRR